MSYDKHIDRESKGAQTKTDRIMSREPRVQYITPDTIVYPPDPTPIALKYDQGKPEMALIPPEAMYEIARVFTFGADKYTANNWRNGFNWIRVGSAVLRHIYSWIGGEDNDPESGCSHLAHAVCGLMFLLTFQAKNIGEDDRVKEVK